MKREEIQKIEKSVARRFLGTLKDKDLMSDTGGVSKSRLREPDHKPPRDDLKKRYRKRRKTEEEKDKDVDDDKDLKASKQRRTRMSRTAQDQQEDPAGKALRLLDEAADNLIDSLEAIDKNLPLVVGTTAEERKALKEIKDILETALTPYTVDLIKALETFD